MKNKRILFLIVISMAFSIIMCSCFGDGFNIDLTPSPPPSPPLPPSSPPPLPPTLSSWIFEIVDFNMSRYDDISNSIAIDSLNNVHISYYYYHVDSNTFSLKHATNASGSWVTETVDDSPYSRQYNGNWFIAIDSLNNVHISYSIYTETTKITHVTNSSGSWITETVDTGNVGLPYMTIGSPYIAIDSLDNVHVSYVQLIYSDSLDQNIYSLKHTTNSSGSWVSETVDDGLWWLGSSSIAIDSSNNVHISYRRSNALFYATNASGSWVTETVDDSTEGHSSIAIDSSNNVHISYSSYSNLKHATNASGSWVTETVDDTTGGYGSIAVDSSDNVHISYKSSGALLYATNSSGSWVNETVDNYEGYIGCHSIAIDSLDNVHISYQAKTYLVHVVKQ